MPDPASLDAIRAAVDAIVPPTDGLPGAAELGVERHIVEQAEGAMEGSSDLIAALLNAYAESVRAGTGFAAAEFPTPKGAGKNADFTFSVSQWLPEAKWAGSKEFDAEYFKRYNSHPQYHAMQAYAVLLVAARAMANAKSTDSAKIRDAIKNLDLTSTPFGPIRFAFWAGSRIGSAAVMP